MKNHTIFKQERELWLSEKETLNKIEGLKEKVEHNENEFLDYLLDGETKGSKLLNDLEYEKHDALHNIILLEN